MTRAVEPGADTPAHIPRWPEVQARTGLSRSTIYRRLAEGSDAFNGDEEQTMASLSRTGRVVARTALALWLLFPGLLWAQGTSPVGGGGERAAGPVHGSDRSGALADCDRGGRVDVRVRRGREQADAGRDHLRARDGDGCGQLPGLALLVRGLRRWAGYAALNRPLTILGVERRGFLLSRHARVSRCGTRRTSLVTGGVVFAVGFGAGWLAGRKDPDMLGVLRAGTRYPARFDPGKWADEPWHLMIRSGR